MNFKRRGMGMAGRSWQRASAVLGFCFLWGVGCAGTPRTVRPEIQQEIQALLSQQTQSWNAGDLKGFVSAYDGSEDMTFASRGTMVRGRDSLQARYEKSYPSGSRGELTFTDLEFTALGRHACLVLGQWHLAGTAASHGVFTLVFRRGPEGWRILHDHSSGIETDS